MELACKKRKIEELLRQAKFAKKERPQLAAEGLGYIDETNDERTDLPRERRGDAGLRHLARQLQQALDGIQRVLAAHVIAQKTVSSMRDQACQALGVEDATGRLGAVKELYDMAMRALSSGRHVDCLEHAKKTRCLVWVAIHSG